MKQQLYMVHSVSGNTRSNASAFSHCSVQGHWHSEYGISYHGDHNNLRWAMSVGCLADPNSPAMRYGKKFVKRRPVLGCGAVVGTKFRALVISDTHFPYHHRDTFAFLKAAKQKYKPKIVLHVGDIADNHYVSYHESETDAYGPAQELKKTRENCAELQKMFPVMDISEGNHDLLNKRKAKTAGISLESIRSYNENFKTKDTWNWQESHFMEIGDAQPKLIPMVLKKNGRWIGRIL